MQSGNIKFSTQKEDCINYTYNCNIQGDSLARDPKLLSTKNYVMFVNQLTNDELTTGYYQQESATCNTSNTSMREIESFFFLKTELSQKILLPPRSPDLTPADFFLLERVEGQSVQKYTPHNRTTQRRYTPRDSSRQRRHFGKSIPDSIFITNSCTY